MRSPGQFARTASPEALFVIGGISQYTGAIIAVRLFDDVRPATVTVFRVISAAMAILLVSVRSQRRWTRRDLGAAAIFGIATAVMNLCFYLAIDRLPLGKSVVIEFVGPITVAAVFTRSRRNTVALILAAAGVAILTGVEIAGDALGVFFIFCAAAMWGTYIVLGRKVAALGAAAWDARVTTSKGEKIAFIIHSAIEARGRHDIPDTPRTGLWTRPR